jgi:hypothetical protein
MIDRRWEASWRAWPLAFYARQSGARQTKLLVEVISYLTTTEDAAEDNVVRWMVGSKNDQYLFCWG